MKDVREILSRVKDGKLSIEDAVIEMRLEPFEDLGYARVDHHRALRQGVAEVIYCAGKTPEQTRGITQAMLRRGAQLFHMGLGQKVLHNGDFSHFSYTSQSFSAARMPSAAADRMPPA